MMCGPCCVDRFSPLILWFYCFIVGRPGRFDREFLFSLPNAPARGSILNIHTSKLIAVSEFSSMNISLVHV